MGLFIDASALVAMIGKEPEATRFAQRLGGEAEKLTSAIALWDAVPAVARVRGLTLEAARSVIADFIAVAGIAVVAIGEREGALAVDALLTYGRGRHRANLNMGDCFAYGCAKALDADLLYKGDDFGHTDVRKWW